MIYGKICHKFKFITLIWDQMKETYLVQSFWFGVQYHDYNTLPQDWDKNKFSQTNHVHTMYGTDEDVKMDAWQH